MTDKSYESGGDSGEEKKEKNSRIWKILVIILLILLLFVVIGGVVVFVPLIHEGQGSSSGVGLQVDPFAGAFVEPKPIPGVTIPGVESMTIPVNAKVITTVDLYNPEKNEGLYYLTFQLRLLDENGEVSETLYESGLLPPGEHIQTITLTRGLPAGTYDAVMHVQPYRMADNTPTNNANLKMTLIVK